MSTYQYMDHAAWMEGNNRAIQSLAKGKNGKEWKERAKNAPTELTEFQKKVCDILGMVGGGIYNAPISRNIDWHYGWGGVSVTWRHSMATFDFCELSSLVFLCHEARIRCSIQAAGPKLMRLVFSQRTHEGSMAVRHPNLDEAVAAFKAYLPADHRIIYREGGEK